MKTPTEKYLTLSLPTPIDTGNNDCIFHGIMV